MVGFGDQERGWLKESWSIENSDKLTGFSDCPVSCMKRFEMSQEVWKGHLLHSPPPGSHRTMEVVARSCRRDDRSWMLLVEFSMNVAASYGVTLSSENST